MADQKIVMPPGEVRGTVTNTPPPVEGEKKERD